MWMLLETLLLVNLALSSMLASAFSLLLFTLFQKSFVKCCKIYTQLFNRFEVPIPNIQNWYLLTALARRKKLFQRELFNRSQQLIVAYVRTFTLWSY